MSVVWGWAFCGTSRVLLRLRANSVTVILALRHYLTVLCHLQIDMILQNNTVSFNAEAPVSFVTAELSSLKYVRICLSGDDAAILSRPI